MSSLIPIESTASACKTKRAAAITKHSPCLGGCASIRRLLNEHECLPASAVSEGVCPYGGGISKKMGGSDQDRPIPALLHHALTHADTEAWPRQRRAVKLAVGSSAAVARSFGPQVAAAAAELAAKLRAAAGSGTGTTSVCRLPFTARQPGHSAKWCSEADRRPEASQRRRWRRRQRRWCNWLRKVGFRGGNG